eukprot:906344-Amphidinium_carterae.1
MSPKQQHGSSHEAMALGFHISDEHQASSVLALGHETCFRSSWSPFANCNKNQRPVCGATSRLLVVGLRPKMRGTSILVLVLVVAIGRRHD